MDDMLKLDCRSNLTLRIMDDMLKLDCRSHLNEEGRKEGRKQASKTDKLVCNGAIATTTIQLSSFLSPTLLYNIRKRESPSIDKHR
jgi:hypothetical protein